MKREIVVVGGGLAGHAAALGFARAGFDTLLLAPEPPADSRTTALIGPSLDILDELGVWPVLRQKAQDLCVMRLVDDTGRLLRAPTAEFRASEIGLHAFGANVANSDLLAALRGAGGRDAGLETLPDTLETLEPKGGCVRLRTRGGTIIEAALVVGADGRRSTVRDQAGIGQRRWSYPQGAVVLNMRHEGDHGATSTEFHTRHGPFTQVPLPGRRSSLVWVDEPRVMELLPDLEPERLSRLVEERMHSILGRIEIEPGIQSFPMSGGHAHMLAASRVALVGEAAHHFPPIGAQGLNLGLRDAAAIVEAASGHRDDPGADTVLAAYRAARRIDVTTRSNGIDLLNRSLLADFLPSQWARAAGLSALTAVGPLRRFAMREGVSPGSGLRALLPAVLQGDRGRALQRER
nr:UbiH/UbiF family hydroxylase [Aureimonas mangrovi]